MNHSLSYLPTLLAAATAGPFRYDTDCPGHEDDARFGHLPCWKIRPELTTADKRLLVALRNSAPQLIAAARFVEEHGDNVDTALGFRSWRDNVHGKPTPEETIEALAKLRAGGT